MKEPDLYKLMAQQARYERSRATLPAYLRGDLPERKHDPQPTYRDTTANTAVSRASKKKRKHQ